MVRESCFWSLKRSVPNANTARRKSGILLRRAGSKLVAKMAFSRTVGVLPSCADLNTMASRLPEEVWAFRYCNDWVSRSRPSCNK